MSPIIVLARLRHFLFALSGLMFVGTVAELGFTGHTKEAAQWIPFGLCGLGLLAVAIALFRPRRKTLLGLRGCMAVVALGGLFGLYEHIANNLAFYLEVHPVASVSEKVVNALGGANPLMAPGILALAAMIAVAATYYHPALDDNPPAR